ncbi:MAG: CoA transferase [Deltaproteobacteria bacterium]|nr:CoA transferase [Deltaproteobacteria bacterium]
MPGPLAGIRVIDCSAYITGPMATMLLADQGAEVVKVEPLGVGDVMRHLGTARGGISALFAGCNRSKRSLALNLREDRGRELLKQLVAGADVFVQNFRPGVVERLGIDEPRLREVCPDLVYVSLSAFGQVGPWAKKPAFDHVVQAASGLAMVQSDPKTAKPCFVRNAVVDKVTALTAAQAITAALLHRAQSHEGQHVELSMLDSAIHFLWPDGMSRDALLGEGVNLRPPIADAYRMIKTRDGYLAVAVLTPDQIHGLMRAVGRPEFIEDPRFSTLNALLENLGEFEKETGAAVAELSSEEALSRLEAEDVPCAPVMAPHEVTEHPQVVVSASVEETEHPLMGRMLRPRHPARFSATPASVSRHAPALGEHSDDVLTELGLSAAELEELREKGVLG